MSTDISENILAAQQQTFDVSERHERAKKLSEAIRKAEGDANKPISQTVVQGLELPASEPIKREVNSFDLYPRPSSAANGGEVGISPEQAEMINLRSIRAKEVAEENRLAEEAPLTVSQEIDDSVSGATGLLSEDAIAEQISTFGNPEKDQVPEERPNKDRRWW